MVGNKSDLKTERVVSTEDGMEIAKKFGMEFIEASAKEGMNVSTAFEKIGHMIVDTLEEKESSGNGSSNSAAVDLNSSSKSSGGCC